MLTDIFAYRYADVPMWETCTARDSRLIVQAWRIIDEDVFPTGYQDKETDRTHEQWKLLNDKLSTELGLKELAKRHDGYRNVGVTEGEDICKHAIKFTGANDHLEGGDYLRLTVLSNLPLSYVFFFSVG